MQNQVLSNMKKLIYAIDATELKMQLLQLDVYVPPRGMRNKEQVEKSAIAHLLSSLPSNYYKFPLSLEWRDRPDFVLTSPVQQIGIEHTEAVPQNEAHKSLLREQGHGNCVYWVNRVLPEEEKKTAKCLIDEIMEDSPGQPWEGNAVEQDWADIISFFINRKIEKIKTGYSLYHQNWLLIEENWPLSAPQISLASETLFKQLCDSKPFTIFQKIFVFSRQNICVFFDGKYEIYPLIDLWSHKQVGHSN